MDAGARDGGEATIKEAGRRVPAPVVDGYDVFEEIARGGMGVVYRALHHDSGQEVALKLLARNLADDEDFLARFQREVRLARDLNHKHVVRLVDAHVDKPPLSLATELMRGGTLRTLCRGRALPAEVVARLFLDLIEGLDYAHGRGLIHRDVKPANLLLNEDGVLAVADFGIAKAVDDTALTVSGGIVGTPAYMSPEQVQGDDLTPASDLFAAGVVLYEMLAGTNPFSQPTNAATLLRVLAVDAEPIYEIKPSVPRPLERVVTGLLVASPGRRLSAAVVRELLTPLLNVDETEVRAAVMDEHVAHRLGARAAHQTLARAATLEAQGAYARAAFLLWQGTQRHPDDGALQGALGRITAQHGYQCELTPPASMRRLVAEVGAAPRSPQVLTRAATRAWAERDLVRGYIWYQRLLALRPDDGAARIRLAEIVDDGALQEAPTVVLERKAGHDPSTLAQPQRPPPTSPSSPSSPLSRSSPSTPATSRSSSSPPQRRQPSPALFGLTSGQMPLALAALMALGLLLVGSTSLRVLGAIVMAVVLFWRFRENTLTPDSPESPDISATADPGPAVMRVRSAGSPMRPLSGVARELARRSHLGFGVQERYRALLERAASSLILEEASTAIADIDAVLLLMAEDDGRRREVVSLRQKIMEVHR